MPNASVFRPLLVLCGVSGLLAGCASHVALSDRECMTRVMYFESNRSSEDGMVAVGTTVMNRLAAPGYPKSVCGVIGQRGQFADGVLDKPMNPRQATQIAEVADHVLAGERHPQVGGAMFFHTAGMTFPYNNMHYVAVAGGNAFYEKLPPGTFTNEISPLGPRPSTTLFAENPPTRLLPQHSASIFRTRPPDTLFRPRPPTTLAALIAESLGFSEPRRRRRVSARSQPYGYGYGKNS
jgi:hypothetical protein